MSRIKLSVLLCTHNPVREHLSQTLQALREQTLTANTWELVVVDNSSASPIATDFDFSGLPLTKLVVEKQKGVVAARLRSFHESQGEVCVIVDDDNRLDSSFLERTLKYAENWPQLGAWGGCIRPEFAKTPPPWTQPFWGDLAVYEIDQPRWGNVRHPELSPRGAGMTVRRDVMQLFVELIFTHPVFSKLGRIERAPDTLTGEDTIIGLEALRRGWGVGNFPDLILTHLLPSERLSEGYLKKMAFGMAKSWTVINWLWGMGGAYSRRDFVRRAVDCARLCSNCYGPTRRVRFASWKGTGAGISMIERFKSEGIRPFIARPS